MHDKALNYLHYSLVGQEARLRRRNDLLAHEPGPDGHVVVVAREGDLLLRIVGERERASAPTH